MLSRVERKTDAGTLSSVQKGIAVRFLIGLSICLALSACLQKTRDLTEVEHGELMQYRNMLIEQARAGKLSEEQYHWSLLEEECRIRGGCSEQYKRGYWNAYRRSKGLPEIQSPPHFVCSQVSSGNYSTIVCQ
jgi:hypothetical protein